MAKMIKPSAKPDASAEEPMDLLELTQAEPETAVEPNDGKRRYVVEVGTDRVELTLEQLLELARLCLESKLPAENPETLLGELPDLLDFVRQYPDVLEFPAEVEEQIRGGQKPLEAYRCYENAQLRRKLRELEQNEANRRGAIGSARSQADIGDEQDDLMAVYKSVFK